MHSHPIRLNRSFRSHGGVHLSRMESHFFLLPPTYQGGRWHPTGRVPLVPTASAVTLPIMIKELLPVVLACTVRDPFQCTHCITVHCDNQAVVARLRSHDGHTMSLAFVEAAYDFPLHKHTRPVQGLDITALAPSIQRHFQDGHAPSTRRAYDLSLRKFWSSVSAIR